MVDPIDALVTFLKADAGVSALVSTRVFGGELPRSEVDDMPRAAVVLKPAGGPGGRAYMKFAQPRIDVDCYAATIPDAWAVHLAVRTALKHMRRNVTGSVLLHSADVSSDGVTARDPDTDWPVAVSSYLLSVAEVTAS